MWLLLDGRLRFRPSAPKQTECDDPYPDRLAPDSCLPPRVAFVRLIKIFIDPAPSRQGAGAPVSGAGSGHLGPRADELRNRNVHGNRFGTFSIEGA